MPRKTNYQAKIIKDKQVKNNAIASDSSYTDNLKKEASKYFDTTDAVEIANIWSVENIELDEEDVVRHRLVKRIITAYKSIEAE